MTKEEILHLADLARIELTPEEVERFTQEFSAILDYVTQIKALTAEVRSEPSVGVVHNIFREDEHPHEGDRYTEDLLDASPSRHGRYVKVKKILG